MSIGVFVETYGTSSLALRMKLGAFDLGGFGICEVPQQHVILGAHVAPRAVRSRASRLRMLWLATVFVRFALSTSAREVSGISGKSPDI